MILLYRSVRTWSCRFCRGWAKSEALHYPALSPGKTRFDMARPRAAIMVTRDTLQQTQNAPFTVAEAQCSVASSPRKYMSFDRQSPLTRRPSSNQKKTASE
jgi:hypothetical protein